MNREGIRKYASEELGINTSKYLFAGNKEEFLQSGKRNWNPLRSKTSNEFFRERTECY